MAFDLMCAGKTIGSIIKSRGSVCYAYGKDGLPLGTFANFDEAAKAIWKARR